MRFWPLRSRDTCKRRAPGQPHSGIACRVVARADCLLDWRPFSVRASGPAYSAIPLAPPSRRWPAHLLPRPWPSPATPPAPSAPANSCRPATATGCHGRRPRVPRAKHAPAIMDLTHKACLPRPPAPIGRRFLGMANVPTGLSVYGDGSCAGSVRRGEAFPWACRLLLSDGGEKSRAAAS